MHSYSKTFTIPASATSCSCVPVETSAGSAAVIYQRQQWQVIRLFTRKPLVPQTGLHCKITRPGQNLTTTTTAAFGFWTDYLVLTLLAQSLINIKELIVLCSWIQPFFSMTVTHMTVKGKRTLITKSHCKVLIILLHLVLPRPTSHV